MDRRIEWSRHQRQLIIHQMARPDYHAFVDAAVLSGAISIPNYSSDLRRWRRAEWRVPPFPWVDPLKEAMATIRLIDSGLTTRKAEVESRGRDFSRVQKQIDKEKDLFVPAYDRAKASGASEAESANSGGGRGSTALELGERMKTLGSGSYDARHGTRADCSMVR